MARTRKPAPAADNGSRTLSSRIFGDLSRYRLVEFLGRDGAVSWMVHDAQVVDPVTGLPAIVRQAATEAEAVKGLAR